MDYLDSLQRGEVGQLAFEAAELLFATDRFAVSWPEQDALSYQALKVLIEERNRFEQEQAEEQSSQNQRKWQTPS